MKTVAMVVSYVIAAAIALSASYHALTAGFDWHAIVALLVAMLFAVPDRLVTLAQVAPRLAAAWRDRK